MLIVCDTSPITNLLQIGHLDVLEKLFGQVIIPEKVFEELSFYEHQKEKIENLEWISVKTVQNQKKVKLLNERLDSGEAEAIVLAKEINADIIIIDEKKGRVIAEEYG